MLHLVRHGRPLIDQRVPAHEWPLDRAYAGDVHALRARLPREAVWFCSPEPKATGTARLLTEGPVSIVADLREHVRDTTDWFDDFVDVVHRAFEHPDVAAYDGWEPLSRTRRRVVTAVAAIVETHPDDEVVLVGHGTAWTLLRASVLDEEPDLDWWSGLAMPDLFHCEVDVWAGDMLAP